MLFIFTLRHIIPSFFTTDIDLIGISKDLIVIVGCWQLGDASYGISWGILCAIGKPAIAAQLNFISFFIVGIPLVYLLGPTLGMGTEGLYYGLAAGLFTGVITSNIFPFQQDWEELTWDTQKRLSVVYAPLESM